MRIINSILVFACCLSLQSCFLINKSAPEKAEIKPTGPAETIAPEDIEPAAATPKPGIIKTLTVPPQKKIRFVAVGDTGTGGEKQYEVARAMEAKCKKSGCDFALILGDNIYNNGVSSVNDPQFISKFERPYQNLNFKFYMTLGNHDYRGNIQAQIDYTKKSKKWVMPGRYYSFNVGPLYIYSIDSNKPSDEQGKSITAGLKNSKAAWKLVFGHHPRYTNGVYKNQTSPALAKMLDESLCGRADIYLCGHEHDKQYLKKVCGVQYLIVGTGAGLRKTGTDKNTLFAKSSYGFSWFEVDEKSMHFQILNTDGGVEYENTLKK
jgi:tartrate-resistant acid phosphatase type 5